MQGPLQSVPVVEHAEYAFDDLATRFVDDSLATAIGLVNMDLRQEYRQVVLLGCGMDTRPYRCTEVPLSTASCVWNFQPSDGQAGVCTIGSVAFSNLKLR